MFSGVTKITCSVFLLREPNLFNHGAHGEGEHHVQEHDNNNTDGNSNNNILVVFNLVFEHCVTSCEVILFTTLSSRELSASLLLCYSKLIWAISFSPATAKRFVSSIRIPLEISAVSVVGPVSHIIYTTTFQLILNFVPCLLIEKE